MILIDDMEMPKNCKECRFMYQDTGELNNGEEVKVYMCSARSQGTAEKDYADKRSEWCPLHEVIDTDTVSRQAVLENICTMLQNCFDASDEMIESVKIAIGEMSSVQPEERTEERMETHGVCLDAIDRQVAIE